MEIRPATKKRRKLQPGDQMVKNAEQSLEFGAPNLSLETAEYKKLFLNWLSRYQHTEALRSLIAMASFRIEELEKLRPQVQAKYKLKKEFMDRQGA